MTFYILKDRKPVETSVEEACSFFENDQDRVVGRTTVHGYSVSTVFLMLDHNFAGGEPILFETMIFGPDDEQSDTLRYHTWEEAEAGRHAVVAALCKRIGAVLPEETRALLEAPKAD